MSFEESVFGVQRDIEISCSDACENCQGTGAKSSSCIQPCSSCGGTGGVMKTQKTPFGVMSQVVSRVAVRDTHVFPFVSALVFLSLTHAA